MAEKPSKIVKLNYCSKRDLVLLKGVGIKRANNIIQYRKKHGPFLTVEDLEQVSGISPQIIEEIIEHLDWSFNGHFLDPPKIIKADARNLQDIPRNSVDLLITSPPYWQKRNYKHSNQIGQEETPEEYTKVLTKTINSWIPLLRPHASVLINIGDTYRDGALIGVPEMLSVSLRRCGWLVVNKIIWAKNNGVPEPLTNRLASRHEIILQLVRTRDYFSDVTSLARYLGQTSNPGDVWNIPHARNANDHLAPFPDELVKRMVEFACPEHVCTKCEKPYTRNLHPGTMLDPTRPQAKRAMELFEQAGLTDEHLKAIRAVGISDAGKGKKVQTGANGNAAQTRKLAQEAKKALGGYFREFTFAPKLRSDWVICPCRVRTIPGTVFDPFMGSGTTVRIAHQLGRIAIGSDLKPSPIID